MKWRALTILAFGLIATACHHVDVGFFGEHAFYQVRGHYRILYAPDLASSSQLLARDWQLENFAQSGDGLPTTASQQRAYWTTLLVNEPGMAPHRLRAELYDLRFVNARDASTLFVRTIPMSAALGDEQLATLARDFVDRLSGANYIAASLMGEPVVRERRFAPRVLEEANATVNGEPAYHATVEMVDVDRSRVDANARGDVATLIFVRPGSHRWDTATELPMIVLVGLATRPEHHRAHLDELVDLVSRLEIRPD